MLSKCCYFKQWKEECFKRDLEWQKTTAHNHCMPRAVVSFEIPIDTVTIAYRNWPLLPEQNLTLNLAAENSCSHLECSSVLYTTMTTRLLRLSLKQQLNCHVVHRLCGHHGQARANHRQTLRVRHAPCIACTRQSPEATNDPTHSTTSLLVSLFVFATHSSTGMPTGISQIHYPTQSTWNCRTIWNNVEACATLLQSKRPRTCLCAPQPCSWNASPRQSTESRRCWRGWQPKGIPCEAQNITNSKLTRWQPREAKTIDNAKKFNAKRKTLQMTAQRNQNDWQHRRIKTLLIDATDCNSSSGANSNAKHDKEHRRLTHLISDGVHASFDASTMDFNAITVIRRRRLQSNPNANASRIQGSTIYFDENNFVSPMTVNDSTFSRTHMDGTTRRMIAAHVKKAKRDAHIVPCCVDPGCLLESMHGVPTQCVSLAGHGRNFPRWISHSTCEGKLCGVIMHFNNDSAIHIFSPKATKTTRRTDGATNDVTSQNIHVDAWCTFCNSTLECWLHPTEAKGTGGGMCLPNFAHQNALMHSPACSGAPMPLNAVAPEASWHHRSARSLTTLEPPMRPICHSTHT